MIDLKQYDIKESVLKIYHLLSTRADVATLLTNLSTHQQADLKLRNIKTRLEAGDEYWGRADTDVQYSSGPVGRAKKDKHGGWRKTEYSGGNGGYKGVATEKTVATAVSYTHLDVYKRQLLPSSHLSPPCSLHYFRNIQFF